MSVKKISKSGKIIVCAANRVGVQTVQHIAEAPYPVYAVITSKSDDPKYEKEIAAICRKNKIRLVRKADLNEHKTINFLHKASADLVILAWWPQIIKSKTIQTSRLGFVNMHPSLLPHSRGKHPYYWSIVEGRPFGVSLHLIDEGIDTGPILFQEEIPYDVTDTGESLYERSLEAMVKLFKKHYPAIAKLQIKPKAQSNAKASFHLKKELDVHSEIFLDKKYRAKDLIDIIRARTFTNNASAFFHLDGKKYYLKLKIVEDAI